MGWGGRWEGGSGWGTHVHPWLIHVNVWQKPPPCRKVISLQLKKKKYGSFETSVQLNSIAINEVLRHRPLVLNLTIKSLIEQFLYYSILFYLNIVNL